MDATVERVTGFVVIDTMVASAILVGNRRPAEKNLLRRFERHIRGKSLVLSFATVTEMRYGALKAGWRPARI